MPKRARKSSGDVQKLLEERHQVVKWLERLDMAGDNTPDDVRVKVQSDYRKRLDALNQELEGYGDELREALDELRGKKRSLAESEQGTDERLAEAKLRHAVGEYDDAKWNEIHSEILGKLVKVREELKEVKSEIEGLAEALAQVETAPAAEQDETPEPADSTTILELKDESQVEARKPAPPSKPAAPEARPARAAAKSTTKPKAKPQGKDFDELAFLKSVGDTAPARRSGVSFNAANVDESAAAVQDPLSPLDGIKKTEAAKTLKCEECGEMNLPTEWYCESCGAELATL